MAGDYGCFNFTPSPSGQGEPAQHGEVSPPDTHQGARRAMAALLLRSPARPPREHPSEGLCPAGAHPCLPFSRSPVVWDIGATSPAAAAAATGPQGPVGDTLKPQAFSTGSSDFPLLGAAAREPQTRAAPGAQTSSGGCGGRVCNTGLLAGSPVLYCTKSLPWLEIPTAHLRRCCSGECHAAGAGHPPGAIPHCQMPGPSHPRQPSLHSVPYKSPFEQPHPRGGLPTARASRAHTQAVAAAEQFQASMSQTFARDCSSCPLQWHAVTHCGTALALLIPRPASPCEQDRPGGVESSPIPHVSAGTHR